MIDVPANLGIASYICNRRTTLIKSRRAINRGWKRKVQNRRLHQIFSSPPLCTYICKMHLIINDKYYQVGERGRGESIVLSEKKLQVIQPDYRMRVFHLLIPLYFYISIFEFVCCIFCISFAYLRKKSIVGMALQNDGKIQYTPLLYMRLVPNNAALVCT